MYFCVHSGNVSQSDSALATRIHSKSLEHIGWFDNCDKRGGVVDSVVCP